VCSGKSRGGHDEDWGLDLSETLDLSGLIVVDAGTLGPFGAGVMGAGTLRRG